MLYYVIHQFLFQNIYQRRKKGKTKEMRYIRTKSDMRRLHKKRKTKVGIFERLFSKAITKLLILYNTTKYIRTL